METLQSMFEESKVKGYFSISQATTFTERCLRDSSDDEDSSSERKDAIELVKVIVSGESKSSGTTNDYHKYAIIFARIDEYDLSCDILLCGLNRYPKNVDLLAGYLIYAISSSNDAHYEKCGEIYRTLQSLRPQFWSWRAYDFSISYLLDKIDRGTGGEPGDIRSECLELAHEFQKRIPTDELAYVAESRIYFTFGEFDKQMSVLKKAMKKNNMHIVRVAITLAEIYIDHNKPMEALACIRRILTDFSDVNSRTTPTYAYVLSIISKTAQFTNGLYSEVNGEQIADKALAREIIDDWTKVRKLEVNDKDFLNTAKTLVKFVEVISDVKIDSDDDL
jgi:tetratricopeptide (TPR) repeat protein